jgi:hypothetical protein
MRRLVLVSIMTLATAASGCAARGTAASQSRLSSSPSIPPRPTSLRGSLAPPAIGAFVRERHAQLQVCYDTQRAADAGLAGKATIGVTLADDGRVADAWILERSWQGDGKVVEGCLLGTVRRWRFPEPAARATRSHSFSVVFSR